MAEDFARIQSGAKKIGLTLNVSKCEIISCTGCEIVPDVFRDFRHLSPGECEILGSPISVGPAMDAHLAARCTDLARAGDRLKLLQAHDALVILKNSLSAPKLLYTLRTSPCSGHPALRTFDHTLRTSLIAITNVDIDDFGWVQANLPVGRGGLGVRSVACLHRLPFWLQLQQH